LGDMLLDPCWYDTFLTQYEVRNLTPKLRREVIGHSVYSRTPCIFSYILYMFGHSVYTRTSYIYSNTCICSDTLIYSDTLYILGFPVYTRTPVHTGALCMYSDTLYILVHPVYSRTHLYILRHCI
jgi:hypothetical protein